MNKYIQNKIDREIKTLWNKSPKNYSEATERAEKITRLEKRKANLESL